MGESIAAVLGVVQTGYSSSYLRLAGGQGFGQEHTWWDLGDQGSFIPGGGMLRKDLSPKPVYEQLKRLIHEEWKTRISGSTDAEGRFGFRGFFGIYRIIVVANGKTVERPFHLDKGDTQEIMISLGGH